ncbi:MAG TPA: DUF1684 domain-containing protein [Mycobacteriales bacterium]|nr:DUF1684 domain-containing protein [Mycobacteriales bacterium]
MSLTLLDWRRRTAAAYVAYRAAASPEQGWQAWCEQRGELFATHPDSAVPPGSRLPFAPYDPLLRFEVELDPDVAATHLDVATGTDGVAPFDRIGVLRLPVGTLDVWWLGSYGGGLFVPVKDASAGRTTYGGGRYLIDTVKGADPGGDVDPATGRGTLVVDLNLAYHPSCAYDPAWACPVAPPGNVLPVPVDAGELLPPGGWF